MMRKDGLLGKTEQCWVYVAHFGRTWRRPTGPWDGRGARETNSTGLGLGRTLVPPSEAFAEPVRQESRP